MASPVVQYWLSNAVLANRGAAGCLTLIAGESLGRNDCINNAQCIIPILRYHGMRPSVDAIAQDVHAFFQMARPRGKPAIKSVAPATIIKSQAAISTCA